MHFDFLDKLPYIYSLLYYLAIILIVIFIISQGRSPQRTYAYIILVIFIPFMGVMIYLFFGVNLRKYKLFSRKEVKDGVILDQLVAGQLLKVEENKHADYRLLADKSKIINLLLRSDKSLLTKHNKLQLLNNGEQKFKVLLEDLKRAKDHIHLEYYIVSKGSITNQIKNILIEKAKEGVQVRVLMDGLGSFGMNKLRKELKAAGVEVYYFMPVRFPIFGSKINYRDHRKIVVIDGKVGYVGGINIDDRYINKPDVTGQFWRDTHMRIEGDGVKGLQVLFIFNWYFASKKEIKFNANYFPEVNIKEGAFVQIVGSGPDSDYASIMQAYFMAINGARSSVKIVTPYFIPNQSIMDALQTAALSGIEVEIIVPLESDSWIVHRAAMSYMQSMLKAGVKIYRYKKGFVHSKIMIVDDAQCMIGTANMDYRSFEDNFEVNAIVYDQPFTLEVLASFEEDKTHCTQLDLSRWNKRRRTKQFLEATCRLLAPIL